METVYLDFNATTPCDAEVLEAMRPYFASVFANPASRHHGPGRKAFMALEQARKTVAAAIGGRSATEVLFTSGATESNNLALTGVMEAADPKKNHLITQGTEHPAVDEVARRLAIRGFEWTVLGVDGRGLVDPQALADAIRPTTALVSIMLANNETGVVQPIAELAAITRQQGAWFHCDAAQAVGKIPMDVTDLGVDLLSLSGHKCYGPKGIGALWIRNTTPRIPLVPLAEGGGHERGLRPGTVNVPGAVGLAAAVERATAGLGPAGETMASLRDRFEAAIINALPETRVNGAGAPRLPNTSNVAFPGIDGEALMASIPGLAVSTGSACASVHPEPSRVLRAMGLTKADAGSALRISLGKTTTVDDVDAATRQIIKAVVRLGTSKSNRRRR